MRPAAPVFVCPAGHQPSLHEEAATAGSSPKRRAREGSCTLPSVCVERVLVQREG